jgi:hypothetical protein
MSHRSSEDRLNPVPPEGVEDTTLGGYPAVHGRAPAFEAGDGEAYTAAIETEWQESEGRFAAYLVFLRWAGSGNAIMGHLETEDLAHAAEEAAARSRLEDLPLAEVQAILGRTIERKRAESD